MLYQLSYARARPRRAPQSGGGRIRTFVALSAADLQSAPFGRSGTPPRRLFARPARSTSHPFPSPQLPPLLTMHPAFPEARGVLDLRVECLPPDTAPPSLLSYSARTRLVNPRNFE